MNNNINSNGLQGDLSPDEVASSLAFVTSLSEQMMPKDAQNPMQTEANPMQEAPETLETAPDEEIAPELEEVEEQEPMKEVPDMEDHMKDMNSKMEEFKGEIKGIMETKFDELKKLLNGKQQETIRDRE